MIYKYAKLKRAIDILNKNTLHFSYPIDLNDPKDCRIRVNFMGHHFEYLVKNSVVLSLSEICDNERMWHKYADNHRGICFGFRTEYYGKDECFVFNDEKLPSLSGAPNGFIPLHTITYAQHTLPSYNSPCGYPKSTFDFLINKTPKWSYEREKRVIITPQLLPYLNNDLDVKFSPDILEEVILGKNMSADDQAKLLRLIKVKYPHVKLSKISDYST